MSAAIPPETVWTALARCWEDLFPLRPARTAMCRALLPPDGRLLDAGCGTGVLVRALLESGLDARGFDLDPGFVAVGRERLPADRIVVGDLRNVGAIPPAGVYDAIVCLGQTFPHLLTDSDIQAFLSGAVERLVPGGVLRIQVVSDALAPPERDLPTLEVAGLRLHRRRRVFPGGRARLDLRVERAGQVESWTVEHRVWTPEELGAVAMGAGLRPTGVSADESGTPWTGRESGWILELRKV
jgi:SAM-dependent methyltransferase